MSREAIAKSLFVYGKSWHTNILWFCWYQFFTRRCCYSKSSTGKRCCWVGEFQCQTKKALLNDSRKELIYSLYTILSCCLKGPFFSKILSDGGPILHLDTQIQLWTFTSFTKVSSGDISLLSQSDRTHYANIYALKEWTI